MREDETRARARALRPKAIWIEGDGQYASVSDCPPGSTIYLFETQEEAEGAKDFIDSLGCGGRCRGKHGHTVVELKGTNHA
jgi:hypothetical protein